MALMNPSSERDMLLKAWNECKEACDPSGWTVSESAAYRGFFAHGYRAALSTQPQQAGWKMLEPLDLNQFAEVCYAAHIDFALDKFPSEERSLEHHYIGLLNRMHAAPLPPVPGQEGEQHE